MTNNNHDDISLMQSVVPDLTRNPGFFWTPASALDADPRFALDPDPGFAGMTRSALMNVAMVKRFNISSSKPLRGRIKHYKVEPTVNVHILS